MIKSTLPKVLFGFLLSFGTLSLSATVFWSPPMEVAPTMAPPTAIALATNDNGDSIAAWYDGTSVFTSILPFSSTTAWSTPQLVAAFGAVNISEIVVVMDVNQNAAIGIVESEANNVFLYLPSGGVWGDQIFSVNQSASNLSAGIDNNGVAFFSWSFGNDLTLGGIQFFTHNGGGWNNDMTFPAVMTNPPPKGGANYPPYLAGNNLGDIIALWLSPASTPTNSQFYVSSRISGTWSTPISLQHVVPISISVADALNHSDQVALIYNSDLGIGVQGVTFPLADAITALPAATNLHSSPTINNVTTAINSQNNIAAAFATDTNLVQGAYYNASTSTWSPVTQIGINPLTTRSNYITNPVVSIDPSNNAPAVWLDASNAVQSSILMGGGSWSAEPQLSTAGVIATYPFVSSSIAGRTIAVWGEGVPTNQVRFALLESNIPPTPPPSAVTNLQGITKGNRFLTQASFSQILTFGPSPTAGVVSYNIYAGADLTNLIGTVSASGLLEFVIPCIFPHLAHTYAVVPVSSAGLLGTPSFVTIPPV